MGAVSDQRLEHLAELATRTRAQTMALDHAPATDTATLLARRIGPRPAQPGAALWWNRALEAVEVYRQTQSIIRQDILLGDPPRDTAARLRWTVAAHLVERADPARERGLEHEL